jgi:antitoxin (DNA-binding transcriptional repressor) of toxin-antitoxin stability system
MIVPLREGKAKLSELVERANQGEDILITVHGKVRARLTKALPEVVDTERQAWVDDLRQLHTDVATGTNTLRTEDILAEDRAR